MTFIATAVFRPRRGDIAVMTGPNASISSQLLSVEAAQRLHRSLGEALRLASCVPAPLKAVDG